MFGKSTTPQVPPPLLPSLPKLAACPSCENQISAKAFACPQCGCPMPHLDEITKVYPEMAGNGWRYRIDADKTIATLTSQGVELRYRQKDFWRIVKQ